MTKLLIGRNPFKVAVLFFMLLPNVLTACTVIVWQNPVTPIDESAEDRLLPGAWRATPKETVYIGKPVDGWMSVAFVNRNAKEEKLFGKMYVSKLDGRSFLNIKCHDPEGNKDLEDGYLIAEYRTQGNRLWFSSVDAGFIEQAVERRELIATISEKDSSVLVIVADPKETREFVRNAPTKKLFPFDQKEFLTRIR
jgi:hypothetical protein